MKIVLSICTDERRQVNKNLKEKTEMQGYLKEETDILNPVLVLEGEGLEKYNYCYIEEFKRYYYITGVTIVQSGIYRITCHVDVLKTYENQIKQLNVIVQDTEETGQDKYLPSPVWVTKVKDNTSIINFPSGLLDNGEFILITAGG